ncbi:siphovirus Gp157 family protein [Clostridium botulinum]|uniref:siphovirus Gp157 family protein n=1 Tax=Clostridium botulinum TaxID=1491 RepID=UPI001C9AF6E3|nr:siphovirus Gp157 family protein [Clostridium botulinum]MBY6850417.1 siphovirus Gp157 family protein [Clostridium botulinum]MBY6857477.1 siphovirus Gp157 family protein [Clostridium botulinum]MBY6967343.1 siphovirus Gp157 family protein [Clostridium botulinum]
MARLYELTQNYNNLLDLVDNPEVPAEMLKESLDNIGEEINIKLENVAKVIKSIEVDTKGLKEEEKRLADRRKSLENRISSLKEYAENSMRATGKKKIKGKIFTLGIQKNPASVDVVNEDNISDKYFITEKKLVKKDVLEVLKRGEGVPGVNLIQSESLRIR